MRLCFALKHPLTTVLTRDFAAIFTAYAPELKVGPD